MTDETALHIGRKLQSIRQDKRITQAEVAKHAGTNMNYYAVKGVAIAIVKGVKV